MIIVGVLWNHLVPLLMQSGPSCVLVIIVSDEVVMPLKGFQKNYLSVFDPKNFKLVCGVFLTICFPPIFDLGHNLMEGKDDLLHIGKVVDRKITF